VTGWGLWLFVLYAFEMRRWAGFWELGIPMAWRNVVSGWNGCVACVAAFSIGEAMLFRRVLGDKRRDGKPGS